jgi:hypothetical protein
MCKRACLLMIASFLMPYPACSATRQTTFLVRRNIYWKEIMKYQNTGYNRILCEVLIDPNKITFVGWSGTGFDLQIILWTAI